jgi:hypothetical protein
MVVLFYPFLRRMGGGTNPKDAAFVVWAGLRGAVGLALAQLVLQSGGDQRAGKQLLFVVAGLALLTLIVQGATCGPLLEKWGMLGIPTVKEAMLEKVRTSMRWWQICRDLFLRASISMESLFCASIYRSTIVWSRIALSSTRMRALPTITMRLMLWSISRGCTRYVQAWSDNDLVSFEILLYFLLYFADGQI